MKVVSPLLMVAGTAMVVLAAGCTPGADEAVKGKRNLPPPPQSPEQFLAKLSAEDRKLAEAQTWCAVETEKPLGSMGVPYKATIKDQPVFLCCKGCLEEAEKHPDETLATVEKLKAKAKAATKE